LASAIGSKIYVPEAKRQYGYYVLPLLAHGQLGGRADLKLDRKAKVLQVRGLWLEGAEPDAARAALEDLATHLGAADIDLPWVRCPHPRERGLSQRERRSLVDKDFDRSPLRWRRRNDAAAAFPHGFEQVVDMRYAGICRTGVRTPDQSQPCNRTDTLLRI